MLKISNDASSVENEIRDIDEPPSQNYSVTGNVLPVNPITQTLHKPFAISENAQAFLKEYYPLSSEEDWNNWRWQIKNSITTYNALNKLLQLTDNERSYFEHELVNNILPVRITPYFASLLKASDALRKTVVPDVSEFLHSRGECFDPLSEDKNHPYMVENIVHRYPDRVLFLATGFCSAYCRYCTRSHMVAKDKCHTGIKAWHVGIQYIRNHPEIRDVLISGGDPLTMPDNQIDFLLSELRAIPHIEIIRIGTKVPVVLPQRITRNLTAILRKYHPLFMSVHFTHADEITPEVKEACTRLANAGIPLGSQTVLLKNVNDSPEVMMHLMHELLKIRVKPYYLYQCDPVPGSAHFRTPVSKGLDIIFAMRGRTSGYAIPHYVIDAPGGGGKIPILPEYVVKHANGEVVLRNFENKLFTYPDTE